MKRERERGVHDAASGSRSSDWLSRRPAAGLSQQHVILTLYGVHAELTTDYSRSALLLLPRNNGHRDCHCLGQLGLITLPYSERFTLTGAV